MTHSFRLFGDDPPGSPVLLSVPHAGRVYPLPLRAALRVPLDALVVLEDRHMDRVALAARTSETLLVQDAARAWIDLNRAEHERDPLLDEGARSGHSSAKIRAGLGLVPRRTAGAGELWRRRLGADEVEARLADAHRPYHAALAERLAATRARFGTAVLLDLHSMPPLPGGGAGVVIGDRFGRAAAPRFVQRVEDAARGAGFGVQLNTPYAGGHLLERHGRPALRFHAVQLEIDRALYLDRSLREPGAGFDRIVALVRSIIDALADEAVIGPLAGGALAQAAE